MGPRGHRTRNNAQTTPQDFQQRHHCHHSVGVATGGHWRSLATVTWTSKPPLWQPPPKPISSTLILVLKMDSLESLFPHIVHFWKETCIVVSHGQSLSSPDATRKNEFFWLLTPVGKTHKGGNSPIIEKGSTHRGHFHAKIHTRMFIAVLFVIAPNRKWSKSSLKGEWLNCCASIPWSITQQ